MELLSVFKADNQRLFVTQIFPGALAFWPFAAMLSDGLSLDVSLSFEWESAIVIFVYILISSAVGLLVEDVGSLFEIKLEGVYYKIKTMERSNNDDSQDPILSWQMFLSFFRHLFTFPLILIPLNGVREWLLGNHIKQRYVLKKPSDVEKTFYKRWALYLSINIPKESEPVILRYYRSVLVRFKFELNTSAALMAMLIGHLIMVIRMFGFQEFWYRINLFDTILYIILIFFVLSILLMEAFKGIELLDELRKKATKISAIKP